MNLIANLVLPLLITMSGGHGKASYNLIVDGVDDQIDCTLNGVEVLHYSFGQSGVTTLAPKVGPNVLICTPRDLGRSAGHPCWGFKYRLFKNWDEVVRVYSTCCAPGCPDQPAPIRTDFESN